LEWSRLFPNMEHYRKNGDHCEYPCSTSCGRTTPPISDLDVLNCWHRASFITENRVGCTHPKRLSCWRTGRWQTPLTYIAFHIACSLCNRGGHPVGAFVLPASNAWFFKRNFTSIRMAGDSCLILRRDHRGDPHPFVFSNASCLNIELVQSYGR
jgi:hypothetical protein